MVLASVRVVLAGSDPREVVLMAGSCCRVSRFQKDLLVSPVLCSAGLGRWQSLSSEESKKGCAAFFYGVGRTRLEH